MHGRAGFYMHGDKVAAPGNASEGCIIMPRAVRAQCWANASHDNGLIYPRFFCSLAYPFRPDKAVMIDFGWKIKLKHSRMSPEADIKDRIRGSVFTPSLWKSV